MVCWLGAWRTDYCDFIGSKADFGRDELLFRKDLRLEIEASCIGVMFLNEALVPRGDAMEMRW